MTVSELAQITNRAFGSLEKSLDKRFENVHREIHDFREETATNFRESEQRLMVAINRIDAKVSHLMALDNDVKNLSVRVGVLEKN